MYGEASNVSINNSNIYDTRPENNFCSKFSVKLFRLTVAYVDNGSLKSKVSPYIIPLKYVCHMLARFEQNSYDPNYTKFRAFYKKCKQNKKNVLFCFCLFVCLFVCLPFKAI